MTYSGPMGTFDGTFLDAGATGPDEWAQCDRHRRTGPGADRGGPTSSAAPFERLLRVITPSGHYVGYTYPFPTTLDGDHRTRSASWRIPAASTAETAEIAKRAVETVAALLSSTCQDDSGHGCGPQSIDELSEQDIWRSRALAAVRGLTSYEV